MVSRVITNTVGVIDAAQFEFAHAIGVDQSLATIPINLAAQEKQFSNTKAMSGGSRPVPPLAKGPISSLTRSTT